jgi:hypothetical protein
MNPIRTIQNVAAQNTKLLNTYESSISQNMRKSDNVKELESRFNSQCSQMKDMFNRKTIEITDVVQSYYPKRGDPNYWNKRKYWKILSEHARTNIDYMENTFDNTFTRLNNLFRRLSTWIRNKATEVYSAVKGFFRGALNRIRGCFS